MNASQNPPRDATDAIPFNAALFDRRCAELGATTTEEKAALAGTDWTSIHRWRKGEYSPRLEVARRVARNLGLSVDDLWPGERAA